MAEASAEALPGGREASSSPLSSVPEDRASSRSPTKLASLQDMSISSPAASTTATAMPARSKKKAASRRTPRKPRWDAETILTDMKSPLAAADLRSVLSNPMAWDALDKDERAEVLALFPDEEHILQPESEGQEARLNLGTLLSDDSFRRDCAAYTRNIADGKHDPEWLASAWAAHERRKMGDFDEFLISEFENAWDVELPEHFKPRREPPSDPAPASTPPVESNTNPKVIEASMQDKRTPEKQHGTLQHVDETAAKAEATSPPPEGGQPSGPIQNEEAIDELQAGQAPEEKEDMPPVKKQKQSVAKGPESEDELA